MAKPLEERLWPRVKKTSGCWEWTGPRYLGYGKIHFEGKSLYAHRVVYSLLKGNIPSGLFIDHLCRVRHCVNPDHLEAVTLKENVLRGVGVTAQNAKKTHCKRGHSLEDSNVYIRPNGWRSCRVCRRETTRLYNVRKAEKIRNLLKGQS